LPEGEHNDVAANIRLDRSDLRTTYTLICAARGLFRIVAAMMAPCSVKARKEVRGETISVSTHLFVQSLGGDAVERCKIRIQPNALTVNLEDSRSCVHGRFDRKLCNAGKPARGTKNCES
jgi:hypothetical protein